MQRELELVKEMRQLNVGEREQVAGRGNALYNYPRPNITAIADLLGFFDGSGDYEIWEKQLELIRTTYHLTDE